MNDSVFFFRIPNIGIVGDVIVRILAQAQAQALVLGRVG
jgi:hypothetical protein